MNCSDLISNSYAPYSGKGDICTVRGENGQLYPGVRVENVAFPQTISAVQNALFCCISEGVEPTAAYTSSDSEEIDFWATEYDLEIHSLDKIYTRSVAEVRIPSQKIQEILPELKQLHRHSRVSYSDFPVSALVQSTGGWFSGVNIEPQAWNLGLCAERVALAKAITYGAGTLQAMHIHARYGAFSSPCGACRQVIAEHMPHHPLLLYHQDGSVSRHFSDHLLPYNFHSAKLSKFQSTRHR